MRFRSNTKPESHFLRASLQAVAGAMGDAWRDPLEIAFVNNMPDLAATATVVQFMRLVRAALGDIPFKFRCYMSSQVLRSGEMRRHLRQTHDDLDVLFARGADALIVTGAEPRAAQLTDESFWPDLARLVDWARENTSSCLWSCLSAHLAVQRLDGIMRRRGVEKFSGVYAFDKIVDDWLMQGAGPTVMTPHSRYNGVHRSDLERHGYHISSCSASVGVNIFWSREPSRFVFVQGHPEYEAETLSREYRRDVIRFLAGERDAYPSVPENYFTARTRACLDSLRVRALACGRNGCEKDLDEILSSEHLEVGWADDATRLYRNWLAVVVREKSRRAWQCGKMKTAIPHGQTGSDEPGSSGGLGLKS